MSGRETLPNRRGNVTEEIEWSDPRGAAAYRIEVTVGFHADGRVAEVFARLKKPGSLLDGMLDEGCILMSRDMQHGRGPGSLLATFGRDEGGAMLTPLGAIAALVARISAEIAAEAAPAAQSEAAQ